MIGLRVLGVDPIRVRVRVRVEGSWSGSFDPFPEHPSPVFIYLAGILTLSLT